MEKQQPARASSMTTTSLRRSRVLIFALLVAFGLYFSGYAPSGLSRAKIIAMVKPRPVKVEEIHGLLHFVTRSDGKQLDEGVDVSQPLPMDVYSQGEESVVWTKVVKELDQSPLVVFSKTYCPYSRRAKALLERYDIEPKPTIIEVDMRDDDVQIKQLLIRLTRRGTFPNVLLKGKSIGGSDDLQALHTKGILREKFEEAGLVVRGSI